MGKFIKGIWIFISTSIQKGKSELRDARNMHEEILSKVSALYCQQY